MGVDALMRWGCNTSAGIISSWTLVGFTYGDIKLLVSVSAM